MAVAAERLTVEVEFLWTPLCEGSCPVRRFCFWLCLFISTQVGLRLFHQNSKWPWKSSRILSWSLPGLPVHRRGTSLKTGPEPPLSFSDSSGLCIYRKDEHRSFVHKHLLSGATRCARRWQQRGDYLWVPHLIACCPEGVTHSSLKDRASLAPAFCSFLLPPAHRRRARELVSDVRWVHKGPFVPEGGFRSVPGDRPHWTKPLSFHFWAVNPGAPA